MRIVQKHFLGAWGIDQQAAGGNAGSKLLRLLLTVALLAAAAAVLALIPLVRSDFFGPMAVAMMGGIVVATGLTLGFLPALYAAWYRVRPPTG